MKPTHSGSRRKKIILFYTMAVVLPGIFLGYLAYRGIRNDQALLEKESRRKLEADSQIFFTAIDSSLAQFFNKHSILSSKPNNSSLLAIIIKDATGSKKIIKHKLLYLPAEFLSGQQMQLSPNSLNEGFRLEFKDRRFSEALRFYENKILKTTNPEEKIMAMVAKARLYKKMNQPLQSRALYKVIRKDYPGYLLNGQIPLGLSASLEILKIDQALQESDEMMNNSLLSLKFLFHPPCEYDENQFDLFYQSFKEFVPKPNPVFDSLYAELETQKGRTDYLIRLINGPDLIATTGANHFKIGKNGISCIAINSSKLAAVYLSKVESNGNQTIILIDFNEYLATASEKLIQKINPKSSINFKIEDNNGKLIFCKVIKEEAAYLSFTFPAHLPQCNLLLSEIRPGFIATLLKTGSGIYLFIFILIALLMVLGFIFTIYTLNEELRLNKLKSEFISNVSHELKSPLTSIRMMTEMLSQNRVQTEERKSAYYSTMLEESERLSHLIDNILDFSRMDDDRKKYDFIDLNLDELLLKFLDSMQERLPEPGFDIRYNCSERIPSILADQDAMVQVFYNLVDNAIKFSGKSRQVDISLSSRDDELLIFVKDYGIGISIKDQEKIFDRFYRGDQSQQMGIRGSGIGLTIVKKIIEAHKGHLTLESRPGEGTTICVHLPISKKREL